jgi:DNA repair protein RadC
MKGFAEAAGFLLRGLDAEPAASSSDDAEAKLLDNRADALTDEQLLALLLTLVMPGRDPGDLPARAIDRFGSFACLIAAPERELRAVQGFGTHSVAALRLLHNAALRLSRAGLLQRRVLDDPARLATYLQVVLARERIEQFRILFLDEEGGLIADEAQARGTVNHTPVYPREVVRRAVELDAAALILVHNHPSGDPSPSPDDLDMTRQVEEAAGTLGLDVRDHVIVGNGHVLSFREQGLLAK